MNKYLKLTAIMSHIILAAMLVFSALFCFSPSVMTSAKNIINGCIYAGNDESNKVSFMINVYWGTEFVEPILKILNDYNVKCTFFIGGTWAEKEPKLLREIYNSGHEVASHGYSHKEHERLSLEQNLEEMKKTHKIVKDILGIDITLFAPPGGSYNKHTVEAAKLMNYKTIMWSKDTIDWRDQNTSLIISRATNNLKGGDLVLMHPKQKTVEALPSILEFAKSHGLMPTTVSNTIS